MEYLQVSKEPSHIYGGRLEPACRNYICTSLAYHLRGHPRERPARGLGREKGVGLELRETEVA